MALIAKLPRLRAALAAAILLIATLLAVATIEARARVSGANGCGNFDQSVQDASDGNVLIPMFDGGEGRNSNGVVITRSLMIEGGWAPPPACPVANGDYPQDDSSALLAAGFTYGGPATPSRLNYIGDPVVTYSPPLTSALVFDMVFAQQGQFLSGNGGVVRMDGLSGADIRFENVTFFWDAFNPDPTDQTISGDGGGLYLKVSGGSRVLIDGGSASGLHAGQTGGGLYIEADGASTVTIRDFELDGDSALGGGGGGLAIVIRGGSSVVLERVRVSNSRAAGNGAGAQVLLYSGSFTAIDSQFTGNVSSAGDGGGLAIERQGSAGSATARLVNTTISGNSAPGVDDLYTSGSGLSLQQLSSRVYAPQILGPAGQSASITGLTRSGDTYVATFTTTGFTPLAGGPHVHFFFDTVPPEQAGVPGLGPWIVYYGGSPFTGYTVGTRPFGARKLCILMANADHSVRQGTGNCVNLP
ncbi:MAG: hypothetical protein HGA45_25780 [Chloroflexales bacterium]|nr:hypothetical protein [Chloroflexales bacterium]